MAASKKYEFFLFKVYCPTKKMTDIRQFGVAIPAGENCPICYKDKGKGKNQCDFTLTPTK